MSLLMLNDRRQRAALEALLDSYEVVEERTNYVQTMDVDVDSYFSTDPSGNVNPDIQSASTSFKPTYFDPARYAAPGRTPVCRLAARVPGVYGGGFVGANLDFKLFESIYNDAVGYEAGALVESVSMAAAPGAIVASDDFELPAGWYLFGVRADDLGVGCDAQVALEVRRV